MGSTMVEGVSLKFLDLVTKNKSWDKIQDLNDEEMQILYEVLRSAGFQFKAIVLGKLQGHYRDQDGSKLDPYPINSCSPFKVIDQKNDDHYKATGWLDCICRLTLSGIRQEKSPEKIIDEIELEINRSIPLAPIQLTAIGDKLREYPPSTLMFGYEYFVKHARDEDKLDGTAGVHDLCSGWMYRQKATETHDVITCRHCHLRVPFPKEVTTYGDLRKHLVF